MVQRESEGKGKGKGEEGGEGEEEISMSIFCCRYFLWASKMFCVFMFAVFVFLIILSRHHTGGIAGAAQGTIGMWIRVGLVAVAATIIVFVFGYVLSAVVENTFRDTSTQAVLQFGVFQVFFFFRF